MFKNRRIVFLLLFSFIIGCSLTHAVSGATPLTGTWSFIGDGPSHFPKVASIVRGNGDTLFAGGDSGVAVWTGKRWISISNTPVYRIVYLKGVLYVIGNFSRISSIVGCPANNIAQWNNKRWLPLGSGIHTFGKQRIKGLAIAPDGSLHVGGDIDSAGGIPAHFYAHWNGVSWDTSGAGPISGSIDALAFSNDGTMYMAIGLTVKQKKGTSWSDISPNIQSDPNWYWWPVEINALAIDSNHVLLAGGAFPYFNNKYFGGGLIEWDGVSWTSTDSIPRRVTDIAVSSTGKVFAVTSDDYAAINTRQNDIQIDYHVVGFNGREYYSNRIVISTVTDTVPLIRCSIALENDTTFQVCCGDEVIQHCNGNNVLLRSGLFEWRQNFPSIFLGKINAFSGRNLDTYVAGQYLCYNGNYLNALARFDGSAWNAIECGGAYIDKMKPLADGGLSVSGVFQSIGNIQTAINPLDPIGKEHGALWKDGTWSAIQPWQFPMVATSPDKSYYAAWNASLCKWNGSLWDTIGLAKTRPQSWDTVPAIAGFSFLKGGNIIAVGRFDSLSNGAATVSCRNCAEWNGSSWSSLNLPDSLCSRPNESPTNAVVAHTGKIYVAVDGKNSFSTALLVLQNGSWSRILPMSGEVSPFAREMVIDSSDNVYLSNYHQSAADCPLFMFDGVTWHNIAAPQSVGSVFSISCLSVLSDSSLYCVVRERAGNNFYYPMRFSLKTTEITHPLERNASLSFIVSAHANQLHISWPSLPLSAKISATIFNLQGKMVKRAFSNKGIIIPLTDVSNGMYVLTLVYGKIQRTSQIFIKKNF